MSLGLFRMSEIGSSHSLVGSSTMLATILISGPGMVRDGGVKKRDAVQDVHRDRLSKGDATVNVKFS